MQEILARLAGADVAMAIVAVAFVLMTIACVQGVKRFLPSPAPADPTQPVDKWAVVDWLSWVPFLMAFVFGLILSLLFDPDKGQPFFGKVRDGLQTGAYAVVTWEGYSLFLKPIIERLTRKA